MDNRKSNYDEFSGTSFKGSFGIPALLPKFVDEKFIKSLNPASLEIPARKSSIKTPNESSMKVPEESEKKDSYQAPTKVVAKSTVTFARTTKNKPASLPKMKPARAFRENRSPVNRSLTTRESPFFNYSHKSDVDVGNYNLAVNAMFNSGADARQLPGVNTRGFDLMGEGLPHHVSNFYKTSVLACAVNTEPNLDWSGIPRDRNKAGPYSFYVSHPYGVDEELSSDEEEVEEEEFPQLSEMVIGASKNVSVDPSSVVDVDEEDEPNLL